MSATGPSLYAALEVPHGPRGGRDGGGPHQREAFLPFLDRVIATQPRGREIHIICHNLAAHKSTAVKAWLEADPSVEIHYTPTSTSWLNQVEIWFAKIQRDLMIRGIFTSTTDSSQDHGMDPAR